MRILQPQNMISKSAVQSLFQAQENPLEAVLQRQEIRGREDGSRQRSLPAHALYFY